MDVKFDEKYLYIGIKAYGDPKKIRATLKNRDQTWNEDSFSKKTRHCTYFFAKVKALMPTLTK